MLSRSEVPLAPTAGDSPLDGGLQSEATPAACEDRDALSAVVDAFGARLTLEPDLASYGVASSVVLPPVSPVSTTALVYPNGYKEPVAGGVAAIRVFGDLYLRVVTEYRLTVPAAALEDDAGAHVDEGASAPPMRKLEVVVPRSPYLYPTKYRLSGPGFTATGQIMRKATAEAACARALSEGRATTMASSEPGDVFVVLVGLPAHVTGDLEFTFEQVDAQPSMGEHELAVPLMPFNPRASGDRTLRDELDDRKRRRVGDVTGVRIECVAGPIGRPILRGGASIVHPSGDEAETHAEDRTTYVCHPPSGQLIFGVSTPVRSVRWTAGPHTLLLLPAAALAAGRDARRAPEAVVIVVDVSGSMLGLTVHHLPEGPLPESLAALDPHLHVTRRDAQAFVVVDLARALFHLGVALIFVCPFDTSATVHECTSEGQVQAVMCDPRGGGGTNIASSVETVFQKVGAHAKTPTTMFLFTDDNSAGRRTAAEWEACKLDANMERCRVAAFKFGDSPDGPIAHLVTKQPERIFGESYVRAGDVPALAERVRASALQILAGDVALPMVEDAAGQSLTVVEHYTSPIACVGGTNVSLPLRLVPPASEARPLPLDDVPVYTMPDLEERFAMSIGLMGLATLTEEEKLERCETLQVLRPGLAFQTDVLVAAPRSSATGVALSTALAQADAPAALEDEPVYRSLSSASAQRRRRLPPSPVDKHRILMRAVEAFVAGDAVDFARVASCVGYSALRGCSLLDVLFVLTAAKVGATAEEASDIRRACARLKRMMQDVAHVPVVRAVRASVLGLLAAIDATV